MQFYILRFFASYVASVVIFIIGRAAFLAVYHSLYGGVAAGELAEVFSRGLAMDLCVAGYLTVIPGLLLVASVWTRRNWPRKATAVYFGIVSALLGLIFVADTVLYGFWGFKLDMTPVFYFLSSPSAVVGGMSALQAIGGILLCIVTSVIIYQIYRFGVLRIYLPHAVMRRGQVVTTIVTLFLTALLFIPIRGGVTVSTMNPSRAYFSANPRLNHAALNPAFNLLYSATHPDDGGENLNFFPAGKAEMLASQLFAPSTPPGGILCDSLSTPRPDVYLIILESFSSGLLPVQGGEPVAMRLDSIARGGLLFTRHYASSFRTDRALPAILNAYPGIPAVSVMKDVGRLESLPSLGATLRSAGYSTAYYYGGDINFTNMKALLVSGGFDRIVCDSDFPLAQRTGKWGAHDDVLFSRVAADLSEAPATAQPSFTVVQTSSSHEPFEVPFTKLSDPAANAFAFTDSIVGGFVDDLRRSPRWDRSLVVLVPDHYGAYPPRSDNPQERHHVPLVMTGGALRMTGRVDTVCSQTDIAATLLSALGLDHSAFAFSNDIFSPSAPKSAYFAEPDLAGIILSDGSSAVINTVSGAPSLSSSPSAVEPLKAWLQALNTDFHSRKHRHTAND